FLLERADEHRRFFCDAGFVHERESFGRDRRERAIGERGPVIACGKPEERREHAGGDEALRGEAKEHESSAERKPPRLCAAAGNSSRRPDPIQAERRNSHSIIFNYPSFTSRGEKARTT